MLGKTKQLIIKRSNIIKQGNQALLSSLLQTIASREFCIIFIFSTLLHNIREREFESFLENKSALQGASQWDRSR